MEEGVFPGGGGPREAPLAAVSLETQGGFLQALRNPAEGERGGAEHKGQRHGHSRYTPTPPHSLSGLSAARTGETAAM